MEPQTRNGIYFVISTQSAFMVEANRQSFHTETENLSGWLSCSSLQTLNTSFNVPSDGQVSHPNDFRFPCMIDISWTMMTENTFRVTGPLWGESTDHRWIPLTKGQWHGTLMFSLMLAKITCWKTVKLAAMALVWPHYMIQSLNMTFPRTFPWNRMFAFCLKFKFVPRVGWLKVSAYSNIALPISHDLNQWWLTHT